MSTSQNNLWTPGAALAEFARQEPNSIALYLIKQDKTIEQYSRKTLDDWSNKLAHLLKEQGVNKADKVAINLPNCAEHIVATLAAFKLGACPTPVNDRLPQNERDALIELAAPAVIISDAEELDGISCKQMADLENYPSTALEDAVPQPTKAIASGGSTGKPKLIVSPGAFQFPWQGHPLASVLDYRPGDLVYSPGPLYHNQAFFFSQISLFQGAAIALNERFNAEQALDFIEQYQPTILNMVPTMMQRMLRSEGFEQRNLSSIRCLWHLAAPCPDWAKLGWMDAIGNERVWELLAATEITGITTISGTDWLTHRGSVGRGFMTDIVIIGEDGQPCPTGEVGEIYTRFGDGSPQYQYLGAKPLSEYGDGFRSVGDLGRVDDEGYLYLADRRTDLIISGGANIYPAEVESVISSHPAVKDVAVIGLPDEDLGRRVHAVIETDDEQLSAEIIGQLCEQQLVRYKVPRSFEFVAALPRNEAGKIRRSALIDVRTK
ncbi:AMP-binding protein [Spongiibacter sp. KMU-158]|uniref:AMP-binding protein n=1 Tax=Spongiibacter pelagi TaxID=2760804 RepID=A0A927GVC4_9GAMM|nr:AMP-binding protein [Spongiibacter pelagi]MBD2857732.1 AMP-binding protein [Spongiibacter pelagi]